MVLMFIENKGNNAPLGSVLLSLIFDILDPVCFHYTYVPMMFYTGVEYILFSIFPYLSIKNRLSIFGYKYQMYHKKILIMSSMLITVLHDIFLHFLSIAIYSIMYTMKGVKTDD